LSASILLKYPAGFISLKAQENHRLEDDYVLQQQKTTSFDGSLYQEIALKPVQQKKQTSSVYAQAAGVLFVLLGHVAIVYLIFHQVELPHNLQTTVTPMTVSIIAPPAPDPTPEPEVVPIIKPIKPAKNTVIKPKKIVEKIVPVENPVQPLVEATTEPVVEEISVVEEVATPVVEQTSAPKAVVVEEEIEQPKFGVAYLNNPAPSYPRLARKIGEEGRVLLKVLVTEQGSASTVAIENSSGYTRLDQSAIDAVKRWRFVPARKGSQALSAYVLVPIHFSLDSN
jgi:periplasmic protein TonB